MLKKGVVMNWGMLALFVAVPVVLFALIFLLLMAKK